VIAGGASVLDHADYQRSFQDELQAAALPPGALRILGQVPDADMPALFRCADVLVFPSLKEGFGLVVLEAMASGVPVVVSRIAPLPNIWTAAAAPGSIRPTRPRLPPALRMRSTAVRAVGRRGPAICARFAWSRSARRHLELYHDYLGQRAPSATRQEEHHA
jgi:glycosyltransferase involved in cell wall biosynthesis